MLFRTRFDARSAQWQLQIKEPIAWFLPARWQTVMTRARMPAPQPVAMDQYDQPIRTPASNLPLIPLTFETYEAAMAYVTKVGLSQQYKQSTPHPLGQALAAGGVVATA